MSAVFVQSVQHRHHVPPFFLVLLVVGSAVQKKRGHQRGVAREGQQLGQQLQGGKTQGACVNFFAQIPWPGLKKWRDFKYFIA